MDLNLDVGVFSYLYLIHLSVSPQSSSHAGDQELVSKMKSLEVENQNLHKGVCVCVFLSFCLLHTFHLAIILNCLLNLCVFILVVENLRAALQKLETRVTVLEKSPASAVVPCNQVEEEFSCIIFIFTVSLKEMNPSERGNAVLSLKTASTAAFSIFC